MSVLIDYIKGRAVLLSRIPLILRNIAPGTQRFDAVNMEQFDAARPKSSFGMSVVAEVFEDDVRAAKSVLPLEVETEGGASFDIELMVVISRGWNWSEITVTAESESEVFTLPSPVYVGGSETVALISVPTSAVESGTHVLTIKAVSSDFTIEKEFTITVPGSDYDYGYDYDYGT
jgi:hypothetical protein